MEKDRASAILVRGLDRKTVHRLEQGARLSGRSLQQEVKEILERAARTLTMALTAAAITSGGRAPRRSSDSALGSPKAP